MDWPWQIVIVPLTAAGLVVKLVAITLFNSVLTELAKITLEDNPQKTNNSIANF